MECGTRKWRGIPTKTPLFSSNKVTFRKSKKLWTKGPEWNNPAYEGKEKSHYFMHHQFPFLFQLKRKNVDVKKKETTTGSKKKKKKTGEKLKGSKLVKLS